MKNHWLKKNRDKKKSKRKMGIGNLLDSIHFKSHHTSAYLNSEITIPGFIENQKCKVLPMQYAYQSWKSREHILEHSRIKFELTDNLEESYKILKNLMMFVQECDQQHNLKYISGHDLKLELKELEKAWSHPNSTCKVFHYTKLKSASFTLRNDYILLSTQWEDWEVE